jgi:hypothetical protein
MSNTVQRLLNGHSFFTERQYAVDEEDNQSPEQLAFEDGVAFGKAFAWYNLISGGNSTPELDINRQPYEVYFKQGVLRGEALVQERTKEIQEKFGHLSLPKLQVPSGLDCYETGYQQGKLVGFVMSCCKHYTGWRSYPPRARGRGGYDYAFKEAFGYGCQEFDFFLKGDEKPNYSV